VTGLHESFSSIAISAYTEETKRVGDYEIGLIKIDNFMENYPNCTSKFHKMAYLLVSSKAA